MSVNAQKAFLSMLGLPYRFAWQRKSSWKKFQHASAWYAFDTAASKVGALVVDGIPGPKTQVHVAASKRHHNRVAPNFALREFACPCGGRNAGCKGVWFSHVMVRKLQQVRADLYPSGLAILSGYRCRKVNASLPGSVPNSAHLDGLAADIPQRVTGWQLHRYGFHGIEVRRSTGKVSHVDLRADLKVNTVFYV
jgi:hypothetical protein